MMRFKFSCACLAGQSDHGTTASDTHANSHVPYIREGHGIQSSMATKPMANHGHRLFRKQKRYKIRVEYQPYCFCFFAFQKSVKNIVSSTLIEYDPCL